VADAESRHLTYETEYELSSAAFARISKTLGTPNIDLFASRLNAKCSRFCAWKPDPDAEYIDAFTRSWKDIFFYAFPPFPIILKVLQKIDSDQATGILVVPNWPTQPWFPRYQARLLSAPIIFPPNKSLLLSVDRRPHPLHRSLSLVAGILSGKHIGPR